MLLGAVDGRQYATPPNYGLPATNCGLAGPDSDPTNPGLLGPDSGPTNPGFAGMVLAERP